MIQLVILGIVFAVTMAALGIITYLFSVERKRNRMIVERLGKIDVRGVEGKIDKIREEENEYFSRLFQLEMFVENYRKAALMIGEKVEKLEEKMKNLENLPKDYERTYRDVVRKILDMENRFTDRFKTLGEAILQLRDEKEKS